MLTTPLSKVLLIIYLPKNSFTGDYYTLCLFRNFNADIPFLFFCFS